MQQRKPLVDYCIPVLSPDPKSGVIRHQQAELHLVLVLRFEKVINAPVERSLFVVGLGVVPAESEETDPAGVSVVDLLLHVLNRVAHPAPHRLPVCKLGPQPVRNVTGLAAPTVEVVGTGFHRRLPLVSALVGVPVGASVVKPFHVDFRLFP